MGPGAWGRGHEGGHEGVAEPHHRSGGPGAEGSDPTNPNPDRGPQSTVDRCGYTTPGPGEGMGNAAEQRKPVLPCKSIRGWIGPRRCGTSSCHPPYGDLWVTRWWESQADTQAQQNKILISGTIGAFRSGSRGAMQAVSNPRYWAAARCCYLQRTQCPMTPCPSLKLAAMLGPMGPDRIQPTPTAAV